VQKVCIIGLGTVGKNTLIDKVRANPDLEFYGVDLDDAIINEMTQKGHAVGKEIPVSDVYIITVYSTDQVFEVLNKIDMTNKPLISIGSTLDPTRLTELKDMAVTKGFDLVTFPHRYNPNDSEHRILNQHRVLGGVNQASIDRGLSFYHGLMNPKLITTVNFETAALSKVVENAYRYIEIAIAQSIKKVCSENNIDYDELRKAVNSKWNIDLKEARDGIKGMCLPKDAQLFLNLFEDEPFINTALQLDKEYQAWLQKS